MDKKRILLSDLAKSEPFKAPEGYFDGFTECVMSQLPDDVREGPVNFGLWSRVRPWVYMAAMFAGIALMIRLFVASPESRKLTSLSDDDYYSYYEDALARLAYDEAFNLDAFSEEDLDSE